MFVLKPVPNYNNKPFEVTEHPVWFINTRFLKENPDCQISTVTLHRRLKDDRRAPSCRSDGLWHCVWPQSVKAICSLSGLGGGKSPSSKPRLKIRCEGTPVWHRFEWSFKSCPGLWNYNDVTLKWQVYDVYSHKKYKWDRSKSQKRSGWDVENFTRFKLRC